MFECGAAEACPAGLIDIAHSQRPGENQAVVLLDRGRPAAWAGPCANTSGRTRGKFCKLQSSRDLANTRGAGAGRYQCVMKGALAASIPSLRSACRLRSAQFDPGKDALMALWGRSASARVPQREQPPSAAPSRRFSPLHRNWHRSDATAASGVGVR